MFKLHKYTIRYIQLYSQMRQKKTTDISIDIYAYSNHKLILVYILTKIQIYTHKEKHTSKQQHFKTQTKLQEKKVNIDDKHKENYIYIQKAHIYNKGQKKTKTYRKQENERYSNKNTQRHKHILTSIYS